MNRNPELLNHALHNEEVCNYLDLKHSFGDWIITTAFYTSLHFVSYKIFPIEIKGKQSDSLIKLEDIYQYQNFMNLRSVSRHKILGNLAWKHCPQIALEYSRLFDLSINARYINYRQPAEVTILSRSLMSKIKNYCSN